MPDVTKLRIAPAVAYLDDVHLGYTSFETPVTVEDESKARELRTSAHGDTPADERLSGHSCTVTVPLVEVTPESLQRAIANSVMEGGTCVVKNRIGLSLRSVAKELKLVRLIDGDESTEPDDIYTFPLASPMPGVVTQTMSAQNQEEFLLRLRVYQDETTHEFYRVG